MPPLKEKSLTPKMLARAIAQAAHDKKGVDLAVLDLGKLTSITDIFVVVSGRSAAQTQAIANNIEDELVKMKIKPFSREGTTNGRWILLDYGTVVAHIFHEEDREFYALEKLWSDAKKISFKLK